MITIQDVRACGFCVSGARKWFKRHGLDFKAFVRDGMAAETLLTTGDDYARRVVEKAERRG